MNMSEKPWHLLCRDHITNDVGVNLRYNRLSHEFRLHDHEFHEFVYVANGNANHYVNGEVHPMSTGLLMLVRDRDMHTYSDYQSENFEYYTLIITRESMSQILSFLGDGFDHKPLFSSHMPPAVLLSPSKAELVSSNLANIFMLMNGNPDEFLTEARIFIVNILKKYFSKTADNPSDIPLWLEKAYAKMQSPKNFPFGTERFFELCGKSREHCVRELSRHYGTTPAKYVSSLRLSYAANLLSSSNLPVSEIAYECGFGSLSSFYSQFEKEYGITPKKYRGESEIVFT